MTAVPFAADPPADPLPPPTPCVPAPGGAQRITDLIFRAWVGGPSGSPKPCSRPSLTQLHCSCLNHWDQPSALGLLLLDSQSPRKIRSSVQIVFLESTGKIRHLEQERRQGTQDGVPKNRLKIKATQAVSPSSVDPRETHLWPRGPGQPWGAGLPSAPSNGVAGIAFFSLEAEGGGEWECNHE